MGSKSAKIKKNRKALNQVIKVGTARETEKAKGTGGKK